MKTNRFSEKEPTILSAIDLKSTKHQVIYWTMFAILCMISFICVFPILWVFMSAFKDTKEFLSVPPTLFPHSFQPQKLVTVWQSMNFGKYYYNSLLIILGNLISCLFFNGIMGYVLSRLRPKGYKLVFMMVED